MGSAIIPPHRAGGRGGMLREHAKLFPTLQFVTYLLLSVAAFPAAYLTRQQLDRFVPGDLERLLNPALLPLRSYLWMVFLALPLWALAAHSLGLYRLSFRPSDWEKIRIALESSVLVGLFLGFLSFALKLDVSRPLIFLFVFYQALLLALPRLLLHFRGKGQSRRAARRRNILIVGDGPKAHEMGELVSRYSEWGLKVMGCVERNAGSSRAEGLGTVSDIPQ